MLVNSLTLLKDAKEGKYAIPQFNINNLEWTRYILETCQELKAPVILGVSEGAAKYMGGYKTIYNIVNGLISDLKITIPVVLHLDHGKTIEACKNAIDAGFTSVMIDASSLPINDNIKTTKEVVDYAHLKNVSVEAEIGHIGGSEDTIVSELQYAKVEDCIKFVDTTNLDSLAPALGSVHGLYHGEAKIDLERMNLIKNSINKPLVLHGGTGISDDQIISSIENGITKININTELQGAWATAVREYLKNNDTVYDPRKIISSGEASIKEVVRTKTTLFKAVNQAK